MSLDKKFAFWKEIPREEISWNPQIDPLHCSGCGMCVTSCGRGVFGFDVQTNKATVENPLHCMVGCKSCQSWCVFNAIGFPEDQVVKDLIKSHNLLKLAKQQLKEKYPQTS